MRVIESADVMFSRRTATRSAEEKGRENPIARTEKRIVLIKTHNWSNAITIVDTSLSSSQNGCTRFKQ